MMRRYTFVVRVHPGERSAVENLATREQAPVIDITGIGPQIEQWVEELESSPDGRPAGAREEGR